MSRREIREQIFKLLFRVEFNQLDEMNEQTALFFEEEDNQAAIGETEYITAKLEEILKKLKELDQMLNEQAAGWDISRMGKVDLTILRLAVYEIKFDSEIPTGVAINEAVELAKKFGQDNSSAFINGVLSKFAKQDELVKQDEQAQQDESVKQEEQAQQDESVKQDEPAQQDESVKQDEPAQQDESVKQEEQANRTNR